MKLPNSIAKRICNFKPGGNLDSRLLFRYFEKTYKFDTMACLFAPNIPKARLGKILRRAFSPRSYQKHAEPVKRLGTLPSNEI